MSRRRRASGAEFDISPLIDVVFILLIFFMVSTTFIKDQQLDLERPGAKSSVAASAEAPRVAIDRSGRIHVEGLPVQPWMLQSRMRDLLVQSGSDTVLVVTDRRVAAEKLIEVVDQCRLAGADNVGVVTDAEAS
jgi:biopolymer transport protein ExbD